MRNTGKAVASNPGTRLALLFALQAIAAGSFLTRIPDIQAALGIGEAALGWVFLGQTLGSLMLIPMAARLVEALGTKAIMLFGLPVLALCTAFMGIAQWPLLAFLALAGYGATFAATNVAMNVEADRVELAGGRRILGLCHGMASLGLLLAAGLGAAIRAAHIPASIHLSAIVPLVAIGCAALLWPMTPSPPRPHASGETRPLFVRPTLMTLSLVGVMLSALLLEGTSRNWSIIYMRDAFSVSRLLEGASLPSFLAAMAIGRFSSDMLAARLGPRTTIRGALVTALIGLVVLVVSPSPALALIGFAIVGLGASVIYPLTLSAAARLGDRPASENVSVITMLGTVAVLGVPALLGWLAQTFGIRIAFAAIVPVLVLSFTLSSIFSRERE